MRASTRFRFVTSTAVLNEVANALCKPKYRGTVIEFYKRLQNFQRVKIVFTAEKLWSSGWEFYKNRPDKDWLSGQIKVHNNQLTSFAPDMRAVDFWVDLVPSRKLF